MRLVQPPPADARGPLPPHATAGARRAPRATRWLERLLFVVAFVCLGYYGYVQAETYLYQRVENRELDAVLASRSADAARLSRERPYPAAGATLGRIAIDRLGVSAIVRAGSDARTLSLAVGHVPGTALPGAEGNVGLAGHRDTFFRRLSDVRSGDEITMATPDGTYRYVVERTLVVEPDDVWVLDATAHPSLTLVTCYPFTYIGTAPQRFIVRATMVE